MATKKTTTTKKTTKKKATKKVAKSGAKKASKKKTTKKVAPATSAKKAEEKKEPPYDLNKASIDAIVFLNQTARSFSHKIVQAKNVINSKLTQKKKLGAKDAMKIHAILQSTNEMLKTFVEIDNSQEISTILKDLGLGTVYYKQEKEEALKESEQKQKKTDKV